MLRPSGGPTARRRRPRPRLHHDATSRRPLARPAAVTCGALHSRCSHTSPRPPAGAARVARAAARNQRPSSRPSPQHDGPRRKSEGHRPHATQRRARRHTRRQASVASTLPTPVATGHPARTSRGDNGVIKPTARKPQAGKDVGRLEVRKLFDDLVGRESRSQEVEDVGDPDTHAADARAPAALLRIHSNPLGDVDHVMNTVTQGHPAAGRRTGWAPYSPVLRRQQMPTSPTIANLRSVTQAVGLEAPRDVDGAGVASGPTAPVGSQSRGWTHETVLVHGACCHGTLDCLASLPVGPRRPPLRLRCLAQRRERRAEVGRGAPGDPGGPHGEHQPPRRRGRVARGRTIRQPEPGSDTARHLHLRRRQCRACT